VGAQVGDLSEAPPRQASRRRSPIDTTRIVPSGRQPSPDGRTAKVLDVPGRPSGLGWRPDGTMLVVSMEDRRLLAWRGGASLRSPT